MASYTVEDVTQIDIVNMYSYWGLYDTGVFIVVIDIWLISNNQLFQPISYNEPC